MITVCLFASLAAIYKVAILKTVFVSCLVEPCKYLSVVHNNPASVDLNMDLSASSEPLLPI